MVCEGLVEVLSRRFFVVLLVFIMRLTMGLRLLVRPQLLDDAHDAYAEGHEPGDQADEEDAREVSLLLAYVCGERKEGMSALRA